MEISNEIWSTVRWDKIDNNVFKLQKEIFKASNDLDIKKVRLYQRQMVNSYSAKLKAVRRIIHDNKNKSTAGIDGVKKVSPEDRFKLASKLRITTASKALSRVWVAKSGNPEKKPLDIPTIKDRCLLSHSTNHQTAYYLNQQSY